MPKRTGLTAVTITARALEMVDRDGLDGLTMRGLAGELGVSAMALYSYFPDRDSLLESVAQRLYELIPTPPQTGDPRRTLHALMHSVRQVLLAHPNGLPLVATYPPRTTAALRFVDVGYGALREAGVPARDTARAYRALAAYSLGTAVVEINRYFQPPAGESRFQSPDPDELAAELPFVPEVAPHLEDLDDETEFDYGLDLTLDGFLLRHGRR